VAELFDAGADGVAICGALLEADDPTAAARSFVTELLFATKRQGRNDVNRTRAFDGSTQAT
jgi:hypothetical protein